MANYDQDRNAGQQSSNKSPNKGNFKNDPDRAAEAGRKGGQASQSGRQTQR